MDQIVAFAQVRTDGKLVPSDMTVEEMAALGWGTGQTGSRDNPTDAQGIIAC